MNEIQSFNIKKGINLFYIPGEKFKSCSISLYFHRKLTADEASKNALLTDVLSRGSRNYPDDIALAKKLQELYGAYISTDVIKKGEDQMLSFTVKCLSDKYVKNNVYESLSLLFELIFDPYLVDGRFNDDYVSQEKTNLVNDIKAVINDKRSYSMWRLIQNMCDGESYGVHELGTEEDVLKIDSETLYNHYKNVIYNSPVDVFITGDVDIYTVKDFVADKLSMLNPENDIRPTCEIYAKNLDSKNVTEDFDVTQGKLCLGFKTDISHKDARYSALMVYNGILGGGAHSKLFNNVREKLSLAYYASSSVERYKGILVISSGIEISNKEKAEKEIFAQMDAIKNGDISDYEFNATKLSIVNSLKSFNDESAYLKDYYLGQVVGGTMVSLEELIDSILAVTKEDVVLVSQNISLQMIYFLKGRGIKSEI